MTIGISKNDFLEVFDYLSRGVIKQKDVERVLKTHIKELNPWLPIDERTPKDKYLLVKISNCKMIGQWANGETWVDDHGYSIDETPTDYQELPE